MASKTKTTNTDSKTNPSMPFIPDVPVAPVVTETLQERMEREGWNDAMEYPGVYGGDRSSFLKRQFSLCKMLTNYDRKLIDRWVNTLSVDASEVLGENANIENVKIGTYNADSEMLSWAQDATQRIKGIPTTEAWRVFIALQKFSEMTLGRSPLFADEQTMTLALGLNYWMERPIRQLKLKMKTEKEAAEEAAKEAAEKASKQSV